MLEPGHYVNVFEVVIPEDQEISVMVCDRREFPSLKALREEISQAGKDVFVYAPEKTDRVYGYGKDIEWLKDKGFATNIIKLNEEPRLTGRIVLDAFIEKAKELDYTPHFLKNEIGRCCLFNWDKFQTTPDGNIKVFTGYDMRVVFLRDEEKDELSFNVIIDACYKLRDLDGEPVNYQTIVSRFGRNTLINIRQIQGDLIPTGKINTEVSRKRLLNEIIPFIEKINEINLPCGACAKVKTAPLRIVLGEENESIW